jgi:DNA-binding MarR family transcriptional regulator
MRMCDLATSVILSRSGLTRLVDRLEREGLVERQSCPQDARGSYAVLTERGRERLQAARATHLAGVRALFLSRFAEAELEQLGTFFERVVGPSDGSCGC